MKTILILLAVLLAVSLPAMAAKVTTLPITHEPIFFEQAYDGDSDGNDLSFAGYSSDAFDVITAVPGVLALDPGINWANFVRAAQANVPYTIKNVVLTKLPGQVVQCADVFDTPPVSQQGTPNIRLWWPLMYEVPGTQWTLTILYGTGSAWDDDGPGPNPPSYVHTEVWTFAVDANLDSLESLLNVLHQVPFGTDEVPLISDEVLFGILLDKLAAIQSAIEVDNDLTTAGLILGDFEMEVMDACIGDSPLRPNPTGTGTGIAQTEDNPACCKLLVDAEFIGYSLGLFMPSK